MAFCDFIVQYDPKVDSMNDVAERILYSLYIGRLKARKPVVTFIGADSGEGKSMSAAKLMEVLSKVQGLNLKDFLHEVNVYTPLQYPEKLNALLFNKDLKKANMIAIHEAREVIRSKNWQGFVNQAIGDVNAMSRSVKRLMIFIIAQFIKDIDPSIRYTLNYYIKIFRPKGKRARLYISTLWKDDRDIEKPRLRKRRITGFLKIKQENGRFKYRRFTPEYLEISLPDPEIVKAIEEADTASKRDLLAGKMDKLIKELKDEFTDDDSKINSMVNFYSKNVDNLGEIGKRYKNGFRINKEFREMHDLNKKEVQAFEAGLNKRLLEAGIFEEGEKDV